MVNCFYDYYYQYNDGTYVCAEYDARTGMFYNPIATSSTQPPPEAIFLFFILAFVLLFSLIYWLQQPQQSNSVESSALPAIPDYSNEIAYWQNESRRIEAETQARAKQAEQEEFENWLRRRSDGQ